MSILQQLQTHLSEHPKKIAGDAIVRATTATNEWLHTSEWDGSYGTFDRITGNLAVAIQEIDLIKNTNTSSAVRESANKAIKQLEKFQLENFETNREIYQGLQLYVVPEDETAERRFCRERINRHFKRQGFDLPPEEFEELKDVRNICLELCQDYQKTLNDFKGTLVVQADEMNGIPKSFRKQYRAAEDFKQVRLFVAS